MKENWTILWENSNNTNAQGATFSLPYLVVTANFWHAEIKKETSHFQFVSRSEKGTKKRPTKVSRFFV